MNIAFKQILHLEIWHDYFLAQPDKSGQLIESDELPSRYDISNTIAIIPTQECQKALRNLRWIFRSHPYGASLLAQVNSINDQSHGSQTEFTPFVPIDANTRLTFWLVVRDRNFVNYTNLRLDAPQKSSQEPLPKFIYYFSNYSKNEVKVSSENLVSSRLFLSQPFDSYSTGATYYVGDLVIDKNQEVRTLVATKYQTTYQTPPPETIEPHRPEEYWMKSISKDVRYVSVKDCLPRLGLSYPLKIPQSSPDNKSQFLLRNLNGEETFSQSVEGPAGTSVSLNFAGQTPGRYQLRWNNKWMNVRDGSLTEQDEEAAFVLFDPLAGREAFALIEISLNSSVLPSFRLLEGDEGNQQLQTKIYRIHFKNRATFWRYHFDSRYKGTKPTSLVPVADYDDTYATRSAMYLSRRPKQFPKEDRKLPAPDVSMIAPKQDGGKITQIFSDIYL